MIVERLKQYIDEKGITIAAFEKSIGMSNASFGKSLKNKGAIGSDKLENILSVYSDINPEWLLTGEGSMLKPVLLMTEEEMDQIDREEKKRKWNTNDAKDEGDSLSQVLKVVCDLSAENALLKKEIVNLTEVIDELRKEKKHHPASTIPMEKA